MTAGFGGTQRLPRRVGPGVARELLYTGKIIGAEEAARIGLANKVVPPDALMDEARATAKAIAGQSPNAVALTKRVVNAGEGRPLAEGNALEVDAFGEAFDHDEQSEGMGAFLEKRAPSFRES